MTKIIVITVVVALVIVFAVALIRFNLKRVHIIRCAAGASDDQLERIYQLIDGMGTEPPVCAVLARTNRTSQEASCLIPLPSYFGPWARRVITLETNDEPALRFCDRNTAEPVLRGKIFRLVPIPRHKTKTGKSRNQFSPASYLSDNPRLLDALKAVCPGYPAELLSYLLASGLETFEFDPMFQARVGGSPSWVQDAEFQSCDICKKRMNLILQLPGSMLPGKAMPRGTFFFFGCPTHPDQIKSVAQFT